MELVTQIQILNEIVYIAFSLGKAMNPSVHSFGGACGVMVIVVVNGHGDTSSNPGRG